MNQARKEYLEMRKPKALVAEIEQLEWRLARTTTALESAQAEAYAFRKLAVSWWRQCKEAKSQR